MRKLYPLLTVLFAFFLSGCIINGFVTNENGQGVADVTMTLSGPKSETVTTDATGKYQFDDNHNWLPVGTYTVTPSKAGYRFIPSSRSVTITTRDYNGTETAWPVNNVNFDLYRSSGTTFATIGTGGVTGVYYPTGGAIARMVNKKRDEYGIRCTVESTGGSVFNINATMYGDLDFGIAQSDRQYQAVYGEGEWETSGPQADLRSVFSIHPESVTLVATVASGITSVEDLVGKRVNIGNEGSGSRTTAIHALQAAGIDPFMDIQAENAKNAEAPAMLQDGLIDAFFLTVGHPSSGIAEATNGDAKVRIVPITTGIDDLIKNHPYYVKSVIPHTYYENVANDADIQTFGVKATLVTSVNVDDYIVYVITKEVFENLEVFKKLHPAFLNLTKENMREGLTAPIHDGAMTYYNEMVSNE